MRIIALLVVLLICSVGISSATDYYVSTAGNNSLNGTSIETAWLTINHAGNTLAAGDTAYIIDGTYTITNSINLKNSGNQTNRITYKAYNGTPFLTGEIQDTFDFNSTNYITLDGLEFFSTKKKIQISGSNHIVENCTLSGSVAPDNLMGFDYGSNYISILNSTFYNVSGGANAIDIATDADNQIITHDITFDNNTIYNVTGHNGINFVGRSNNDTGIVFYNITISNNQIYNISGGIAVATNWIYLDDSTIDNNTIYNSSTGLSLYTKNSTLSNNYVYSISPGTVFGTNDRACYNTVYTSNNATHNLRGTDITVINPLGIVENRIEDSVITIQNWNESLTTRLKFKSTAFFEQLNGNIFTYSKLSGSDSYIEIEPRYYPLLSNSSINMTVDTTTTFEFQKYDITLSPNAEYLKNVVLNDYNITTETYNITINSSTPENPSWINVTVANQTGTYQVKQDGIFYTNVSASNYIAAIQYSEAGYEWDTPHIFTLEYIEGGTIPLSITDATPTTPHTSYQGSEVVFNTTMNQNCNATWYINSSQIQQNSSILSCSHTNSTAEIGDYNVTIIVDNINSSDSHTWIWTVQAAWSPQANHTYKLHQFSTYQDGSIAQHGNPTESSVDITNIFKMVVI